MTTKHTLTGADVIAAVRKLALEYPENVYQKPAGGFECSNVDGTCTNGTQGCLIGQALVACGIGRAELAETCPNENARDALLQMGIPFTADTGDWLLEVQASQDRRDTWGWAVEHADYEE